ncbi:hypothetical protein G7Y79_00042g078680 [Physcia stellaris]|nr:hypothetical protein G7Y79_00042g078680 [Physcia stellaris]
MTLSTKDATLAEVTVRISKLYDHLSTTQDKYIHDAMKSALKVAAADLVILIDNHPDFDPATTVAISKGVAPRESSHDRHASIITTSSSPSRGSDQVTPYTRPPSQTRSFAHPTSGPTSRVWKATDEQRQRPIAVVPDSGESKNEAHGQTLLEEERVPLDPRKRIVQRFPPQPPPSSSPPSFPAAAINSYGAPTPTIDMKDVCSCSLIGHSCPNPEECGLVSVCVYWHKVPVTQPFSRSLGPHSLIILTTSQNFPPKRTAAPAATAQIVIMDTTLRVKLSGGARWKSMQSITRK